MCFGGNCSLSFALANLTINHNQTAFVTLQVRCRNFFEINHNEWLVMTCVLFVHICVCKYGAGCMHKTQKMCSTKIVENCLLKLLRSKLKKNSAFYMW